MSAIQDRHIAILCHDKAGAGSSVTRAHLFSEALSGLSVSNKVWETDWPVDFGNHTDVWICGGDGTLNRFVNRYPGITLPLGIINGGTGNDLFWMLYGQVSDETLLDRLLHSSPRPVDLVRCNDLYFINGAGIGFEGAVAKALSGKRKMPGKASFLLTTLRKIMTYRSASYAVLSEDGELPQGRYLLLDVSNGARAGGGFLVSPRSRPDDGWLDVVAVEAMPAWKRLRYLPVIEKGGHLDLPFVRHFRTKRLEISSDRRMGFHLDGEYREADALHIEILEGRLLFRC